MINIFLILNSANLILDISEYSHYVRRQSNKFVVGCEAESADAIYSSHTDKFYPLLPTPYLLDGHTLVEVDAVPQGVEAGFCYYINGEFVVTEEQREELEAKALVDDYLIDVEYRLSLVELGAGGGSL